MLRAGVIEHSGLSVRASIIGASHVLVLQSGDGPPLHEIFACTDIRKAETASTHIFAGRAPELPDVFRCEPIDGLSYSFRPRLESLAAGGPAFSAVTTR